jgi:hypothetical protein
VRLLERAAGWAVICLLLLALGLRYGLDAFAAGVGLTLAGSAVLGGREHSRRADENGGQR